MGKKLIITEKESVGQQFAEALGVKNKYQGYMENDEWIITWAMGHLLTLSFPEKYDEKLAKWSLEDLPFLPRNYKYEVIASKIKQFNIVCSLLKKDEVDLIYNGGDSGREGELIQRLIFMAAGIVGKKPIYRVWLNTTTTSEILRGLREAKPDSEYNNLSAAAFERSIADYAVGINLSRALSCKFGNAFNQSLNAEKYTPISVGRVMTCVLGIIVRREREIRTFKPVDYYKIDANINGITAHWKAGEKSRYYNSPLLYNDGGFADKETAKKLLAEFQSEPELRISKLEKKTEKAYAPLLYNLAELQSDCSKKYKISPDETLDIAQALYEKKLTTYPRTDARVLSSAMAAVIDRHILGVKKILKWDGLVDPIMRNGWYRGLANTKYVNDKLIKDHYAIIPTGEADISDLTSQQKDVYELICRRFLSIFYPPAEYNKTNLELTHVSSSEIFTSSEKVLSKAGYLVVNGDNENSKPNTAFLSFSQGQVIAGQYKLNTATTKAPPRYTSGNMVLVMESAGKFIEDEQLREQIKSSGIGTSATRAETIKKLIADEHIALDTKTQILTPTKKGELIYNIVAQTVPALLSPDMTASWERGLAQVEDGKISSEYYRSVLYKFVSESVQRIKNNNDIKLPAGEPKIPVGKCPRCGRDVIAGSKGYSCIGYKDKEHPCNFTIWKENGLLKKSNKSVTSAMAKSLLKAGKCEVEDLVSSKGTKYNCTLVMVDDGEHVYLNIDENSFKNGNFVGKCPRCGKDVVENAKGYGCVGYRDSENHCEFFINKTPPILAKNNKTLTKAMVRDLLSKGKCKITGLTSKSGKKYSADFKLVNNGKYVNLEMIPSKK